MPPTIQFRRRGSAKTPAERSREFRERNPTYHAEWKRRERAHIRERVSAMEAAANQAPPVRVPLMLPAPQPPACDLLEQLAALRSRTAELELVLASGGTA